MQRVQGALNDTQQQVATGRRILRVSDDPLGVAAALRYRESLARIEQFDRNADSARIRLEYEETALNAVTNSLQRVRELVLRGLNGTESPESRAQIGVELQERVTELVQIANQQDGKGRYLFSGSRDGTQPVSTTAGGFSYNGDEGQRLIRIGDARQVYDGDSGAAVFFNIRNGNGDFRVLADSANTGGGIVKSSELVDAAVYDQGQYTLRFVDPDNYEVLDAGSTVVASGTYTSGQAIEFQGVSVTLEGGPAAGDEFDLDPSRFQSMFESVSRMAEGLKSGAASAASRARLNTTLNNGLQEIDLALENVSEIRTEIGIRLGAIESQLDSNSSVSLLNEKAISELEDLDYAEALSRLTQQTASLEAAQQSFVVTQRLSLFNFLR
jgi:flagellar hook-associated protein 3 FlgL